MLSLSLWSEQRGFRDFWSFLKTTKQVRVICIVIRVLYLMPDRHVGLLKCVDCPECFKNFQQALHYVSDQLIGKNFLSNSLPLTTSQKQRCILDPTLISLYVTWSMRSLTKPPLFTKERTNAPHPAFDSKKQILMK